jgi:hypothetical protein
MSRTNAFGHPNSLGPKPFHPVTVMFVDANMNVATAPATSHSCAGVEDVVSTFGLCDDAGIAASIDQFRTDDVVFACYDPYWARMTGGASLIFAHTQERLAKDHEEASLSQ